MKSTHRVEVVPVKLESHPNADSLSIVRIYGYTCCVRTADWKDGDLAAYIPPDSVVPQTPDFAFLGDHRRIKVRKMRGRVSQGLLMPAPPGSMIGDDVAEVMGITHYEPPEPMSVGGDNEKPPDGFRPVYDVEGFYRYGHLFVEGEPVYVSEKIHGASGRFCWQDGRMHCGSRTTWKKEDATSVWWKVLPECPWLIDFCKSHPEQTVYGEVFGVQDLKYGKSKGQVGFAVFDLLRGNEWVSVSEIKSLGWDKVLAWCPTVYEGGFQMEKLLALAEGQSLVSGANHIREGVVVKPLVERTDPEIGRVQLKIVSNTYLEKA